LGSYLKVQQQKFLALSLKKAFQFDDLVHESYEQYIYAGERQISDQQEAVDCLKAVHTCLSDLQKVGIKFIGELDRILPSVEKEGFAHLHQRVSNAANYFGNRLNEECINPLTEHIKMMIPKKKTKKYVKDVQLMLRVIKRQKANIDQAKLYAEGLLAGTDVSVLLKDKPKLQEEITEEISKTEKPKKGESHRISLEMFQTGKSIEQIAAERNFSVGTIEGHLCTFLATGEIYIEQLIDLETQKKITAVIDEIGPLSAKTIKERLEDSISYGQIKAAVEFYKISNNSNK
jgi:translation elongation factor P/translation initiation factor 5A